MVSGPTPLRARSADRLCWSRNSRPERLVQVVLPVPCDGVADVPARIGGGVLVDLDQAVGRIVQRARRPSRWRPAPRPVGSLPRLLRAPVEPLGVASLSVKLLGISGIRLEATGESGSFVPCARRGAGVSIAPDALPPAVHRRHRPGPRPGRLARVHEPGRLPRDLRRPGRAGRGQDLPPQRHGRRRARPRTPPACAQTARRGCASRWSTRPTPDQPVAVLYRGSVPDQFKVGREVVVTGQLRGRHLRGPQRLADHALPVEVHRPARRTSPA